MKPFRELSIIPGPAFSLCCAMRKKTWFHADSIQDAFRCKTAQLIRENACDNIHRYCPGDCSHWQSWDGSIPEVKLERCEIAVAFQCNARCIFCFNKNFTAKIPDAILDEYKTYVIPKVNHLAFGGGEPLLVAKDLIHYALSKRPDITISMTTNGILLDRIMSFLDNVDGFNLSLNAGSRETFKKIFGVDAFDLVVDNVKAIKAAGFDKSISSTFVICRENIEDAMNYIALCKQMGVDSAGFNIDQTDPFFKLPRNYGNMLLQHGKQIGIRIKLGNMRLESNIIAKVKRLLLWYIRYRSRRR
jgi:sulfatase maturation enzyme AslB (radical SAM superfamily)